jgi:hypothetical protein
MSTANPTLTSKCRTDTSIAYLLVLRSHQVVDNMGSRGVPSRVAEPLLAVRGVAPHHARRVVDPTVRARVFGQISQSRALRSLIFEHIILEV